MALGHNKEVGSLLTYRFGDFELSPEKRTLRSCGVLVDVQPKPFDFMVYLIRNRDRVVTRGELLTSVWAGVSVSREAMAFVLHAARKALGDCGSKQMMIRTIRTSGFRFVAPVEINQETEDSGGEGTLNDAPEKKSCSRKRVRFVGREKILLEVNVALESLVTEEGGILFLSGDAGIGKTRTTEKIANIAKRREIRALFGRCIEAEWKPAFWPWVQIIRSLTQDDLPLSLVRMLVEGAPELARMVPELRVEFPSLPEPENVDPKAARFFLFDGVTRFLKHAAEIRPLVLILDDLHCADQSSLLLLQFLAREVSSSRILIIGTYRPTELCVDTPTRELIEAASRETMARMLELEGFSRSEVLDFVIDAAGRMPSDNVVTGLHEQTGGNPFFLAQILHVIQAEGRLHEVRSANQLAVTLPPRVQGVIAHQLETLPTRCRATLQVAAVIGREFQLMELELATHRTREEILDTLCAPIAAGLVKKHGNRPGAYRFSHILVREALYQELTISEQSRLHAHVGKGLEALWGTECGSHSAVLAHHFFLATAIGEGERALRYGALAAEWSCDRGAFEEAPQYLERAIEILKVIAPRDEERRCELLLALGDAQTKAGSREEARKTLFAAARAARNRNLPEKLARAALRFAPDFLGIETGVFDPVLVELLEEALATLDSSDSAVRARLLVRLALSIYWANGSERRRRQLCDEALRIASRLDDPETLSYVRSGSVLAHYSMARPERYLRGDAGGPLARGDEPIALVMQLLRMTSLLVLGSVAEFDSEIGTFSALAERLRQPQSLWYSDLLRATRLHAEGRFDESEEFARRYLAEGKRASDKNAVHSYLLQTLMSAIDVGGLDTYVPLVKNMVDSFPRVIGWRAGLLLLLSEVDRIEEAREQQQWLMRAGALSGPRRNEWFATMGGLALTSMTVRDERISREVYAQLSSHSGNFAVIGYCSLMWGPIAHMLGVLAHSLGRWNAADTHFEDSLGQAESIGARPSFARSQLAYGAALLDRGEHLRRAEELLRSCHKISGELGMIRLANKAQNLLEGKAIKGVNCSDRDQKVSGESEAVLVR